MKKIGAEQHEWFLFAILLVIGTLLMLIAGQFALQMPRTWQISDTNMDSKLNPDEVYVLYRGGSDLRLAPIRTDIPDLLATAVPNNSNPESILPPSAVEFKAPAQIATTTPFQMTPLTAAAAGTASSPTANASGTASATLAATLEPTSTETLIPTETPSPLPTSTVRRIPTRAATRTRTPMPTARPTNTSAPVTPPTPTRVVLPADTLTPTVTLTATPVNTATATFTATATATPTATATATPTPTFTATLPSPCASSGVNDYIVPVGGCSFSYVTTAQGAIFSLDLLDSGNLLVNWFGLLEDQTSGVCTGQSSNLTRGIKLNNIAVVNGTNALLIINNSNNKPLSVQITVSDWLVGGCLPN